MKISIILSFLLSISVALGEDSSENKVEVVQVSKDEISTLSTTLAEDTSTSSMSPTPTQSTSLPTTTPRRRKIFYINQQQSGKFNVHLEFNDVSLVVIPKNNDPQTSLLNLLLKSSQKSNVKSDEKHKGDVAKVNGPSEEYSKYKMDNYVHTSTIEPSIESRAPYHVDISSTLAQQQPVVDIQPKMNAKTTSNITRIPLMKILKPIPIVLQPQNTIKKISKRAIDTSFLGINSNVLGDSNIPDESEDDRDLINKIESNNNDFNYLSDLSDGYLSTHKGEFSLLGAAENCGPGRRRNSYQICVPVTDY